MNNATELIELDVIHDTFVSGLGTIQIMGPNVRFTFYVDQNGERVVVDRLVMAVEAVPECIRATIAATWRLLAHSPAMEIAMADRIGRH